MMEEEQGRSLSSLELDNFAPSDIPFIERYGISPPLFALISLIVVFILYQIVGGLISYLVFGLYPTEENVFGFRAATGLGQLLFLFIPTLLLVRLATFSPKEYFRLRMPPPAVLAISFIGIISLQQMLQIYLVFQDRIPLPESLTHALEQYKEMVEQAYKVLVAAYSIPELLWVILVIAVIPAIAEEFLFRGLVQRSFENGPRPFAGVIITGIIFAAYHLVPYTFVPLAALGIYLGFLTYRANNIWASITAHFCNNAIACIATYMNVDNDAIVTGNPKEMSLAMLLGTFWFFGVVFLVSIYFYIQVTKKDQEKYKDEIV